MFKSSKMPSPLPPSESTKLGKLRVCHKPGIAKKLSRSVSQHMGKKFATFYHASFCEVDNKFDFTFFFFLFYFIVCLDVIDFILLSIFFIDSSVTSTPFSFPHIWRRRSFSLSLSLSFTQCQHPLSLTKIRKILVFNHLCDGEIFDFCSKLAFRHTMKPAVL